MRILYLAHGIPVPGHLGGSTHAREVAQGLARRGHTVHLVAASPQGASWNGISPFFRPVSSGLDGFRLHHQDIPRALGWLAAWTVLRLAQALRPDVVMERYYNFCGAGVWVARHLAIPCLLEVNALIVDPPVVLKRRIDDALGGPMRWWATTQCRWADRIVTPLHTTVPAEIPRHKIVELPWGADVERFSGCPGVCPQSPPTALFLGSFRAWHGVVDVVRAAVLLLEQGYDYRFVLVGDGPERAAAEQLARPWAGAIRFLGAIPYEQVPAVLSRATVGVAPFTTRPHPALRAAGFFWSPLKIYEYMAASLPVITANLPPLHTIVRDGQEGVLFREDDVPDLARAITQVLGDPQAAREMGRRARARVVASYSWQRHCAELEQLLETMVRGQ
ncbi:MAG: glycosyltransferase family 4 protein [Chloroflexaceae bacterium]|nr:glycosyltransferase family 4 protein [Chloroflexaceae bacterium]